MEGGEGGKWHTWCMMGSGSPLAPVRRSDAAAWQTRAWESALRVPVVMERLSPTAGTRFRLQTDPVSPEYAIVTPLDATSTTVVLRAVSSGALIELSIGQFLLTVLPV